MHYSSNFGCAAGEGKGQGFSRGDWRLEPRQALVKIIIMLKCSYNLIENYLEVFSAKKTRESIVYFFKPGLRILIPTQRKDTPSLFSQNCLIRRSCNFTKKCFIFLIS
ncbi:hypothetical protein RJT34_24551 [Clitoria ternatea]|uniref:Uncharacterized protein n=1 Tax=Clitoria ternatea TaxID=43366 RepID=A0AAN9FWK0_CLITE